MALTVRELFELDIFKNFQVLAGEGGLDRPVEGTDTLDFEFAQGARMNRETVMVRNHLVLSTLLYTGGDPGIMTEAIQLLYEMKVSGLAYKNGMGYEIPQEALDFADAHDFPLLQFGGDEFFEDVMFAIHEKCGRDSQIIENEMKVEAILRGEMPDTDVIRFGKSILVDPRKYIMAVYTRCDELDRDRLDRAIERLEDYNRTGSKAYGFKFRNGYFLILSQDTKDLNLFDAQYADVSTLFGITAENTHTGYSLARRSDEGFAKVLKEAYWTSSVAFLEGKLQKNYEDIGIYRILIAEINSQEMTEHMQEYLAPLLTEDKGRNSELMTTAEIYVLCGGDLEETAKKLFCHKNTVRYRLSRLHEMLSPGESEKEFYVNLSFSVRLYILQRLL